MKDYPDRVSRQEFKIDILPCEVLKIRSNDALIVDQEMMWGDNPVTFSATEQFGQFEQVPNCGYDFEFTPLIMVPEVGGKQFPIPNSATYIATGGQYVFMF